MAILEFNPTDIRVFEGVPPGTGQRQFGIDITTGLLYYTDPTTGVWTALNSGPLVISSVFGRVGAVVAVANDYTFNLIGAGSNLNALVVGSAGTLKIAGTGIIEANHVITGTPASAAAAGVAGQVAYDSSFIYVCVATNTWTRAAIATW